MRTLRLHRLDVLTGALTFYLAPSPSAASDFNFRNLRGNAFLVKATYWLAR